MGFTPGPNNAVASYSAFNFGVRKTFHIILGVLWDLHFSSFINIWIN